MALASFGAFGSVVLIATRRRSRYGTVRLRLCPTVDLRVAEGIDPAPSMDNPIGDALGEVNDKTVGVMLLQRGGYLVFMI